MALKDNIHARRKELGYTLEYLAKKLKVSRQTVQRYESGVIGNIPSDKIEMLAAALDCSPAQLMGWEDFEEFATIKNLEPLPATQKLPLLGNIACGDPILAEENIEDYVEVPENVHADFVLRCKGDSMVNARIYDGDIVFIRKQPNVENGEIAAVLIDDEATLKRVYKKPGRLILQPENPDYEPFIYVKDEINDICILGKAVAFLSTIR